MMSSLHRAVVCHVSVSGRTNGYTRTLILVYSSAGTVNNNILGKEENHDHMLKERNGIRMHLA